MKIVAAAIVRNAERSIELMIRSLSWADVVVVCNDHSSDGTETVIQKMARDAALPPIECIVLGHDSPMMSYKPTGERDLSRELTIRNRFVQCVFANYSECIVVLVDGDEMISGNLRPYIQRIIEGLRYDNIALSCIHLYDLNRYLHVYPATWNGVSMIDPHVRVLKKFHPYEPGTYPGVPDCFIRPSERTLCVDQPSHIHLRYLKCLGNRNAALRNLPADVRMFEQSPYCRPLDRPLPLDLLTLIERYLS